MPSISFSTRIPFVPLPKPSVVLGQLSVVSDWMTPKRQIKHLLECDDSQSWEAFRDGMVRRWTNLNIVVCLLRMLAIV